MARLRDWVLLVRPVNVAMSALGVFAGGVSTPLFPLFEPENWTALLVTIVAGAVGVAGTNAVNDALDWKTDKSAHPERPVARGAMTPRSAFLYGSGLMALALAAAYSVSWRVLAFAAAMAALAALYEFVLKSRGLLGHVTVSVNVGGLFVLGGLAVWPLIQEARSASGISFLLYPVVMGGLAAILNLSRELLKSAEDAPHEALVRATFAVRHGVGSARLVGTAVALAAVPVSLLPPFLFFPQDTTYVVAYVASIMPLYAVLMAVPFLGTPTRQRAWLKVALLLGFLPFLLPPLLI